jgi:ribonucleoside-diphosphate reductase alpha chain
MIDTKIENRVGYSYEEALDACIKYFDGDELASRVFLDKYALRDNNLDLVEKTPDQMHRRLAKEFARIEKKKFKNPYSEEFLFGLFDKFKYIIPQGSPMFGIGNEYQFVSISNCFVVDSPIDSYSSILKTDEQLVQISKRRGGVGVDISYLRPRGALTHNAARTSTGIVSWMERYSNTIREVGQCIEENQRVLTKTGLKKIKNVSCGEYVWTKVGWICVVDVVKNGKKKLFKVTTKTGFDIITSEDHVYQTFNKSGLRETRLQDLSVGDMIVLCIGDASSQNSIQSLITPDYVNINHKPANCKLPTHLTEQLAYVLGYSYGDGYVYDNDRGLDFACSNDYPEIKDKLEEYVQNIFDYKVNRKSCDGDCEVLSINNKTIVAFLKENCILKERSGDIKIPEKIIQSPISTQCAFISGYFDADGYNSSGKKGYCFSSISLNFLQNIQIMLNVMGILSKIHTEHRKEIGWKTIYTLVVVGKTSQQRFVNLINNSTKIDEYPHVSKRDCWISPFYAKQFNINCNNYSYCPNDQMMSLAVIEQLKKHYPDIISTLTQDQIINIEEVECGETYDLVLESEHLFWCEGFYVHNSGRRGALMLTLDVHHPDSQDFIIIKNDRKKVTGANISVRLSDDFMESVESGGTFDQKWKPERSAEYQYVGQENAKTVWDLIIQNAHTMAEPGVLFWDTIIRESLPDRYAKFGFYTISTNPCGEITLCAYDSCRLLVLNLFNYVVNPFTENAYFDWNLFCEHVAIAQRLMDDIVDIEIECVDRIINKIKNDPEPLEIKNRELALWNEIKRVAKDGRRTGTGQTGLGDCLAALGIGYGSKSGLMMIDQIYETLKLESYRSSMKMAKELGPFPIWNSSLEQDHPYLERIKQADLGLYDDMMKYGRRNIALLTTAPCGTAAILARGTSGFEPLFCLDPIIRRKKGNPGDTNFRSDFVDQNGDHWMEFKIYHPTVQKWMDITGETDLTKSPWYGHTAHDINWEMRVKAQGIAQKHVDHSISSTVNLPEDVSVQEVEKIYMTAWKEGLKGITIYRDNCRTGVLVKESKKEENFETHSAPKRPKELPCDVFHVTVRNKPYFVIVGKLNEKPYEVFASINENENGETLIPKNYSHGICFKEARGHYKVKLENCTVDPIIIKKIDNQLDENEAALARMISTSLRHGADVQFVVHQLEKVEGSLFGFCKAIAKSLKKYIKDGTEVKGEVCPKCSCENSLIRQEGCVQCKACGWSKC